MVAAAKASGLGVSDRLNVAAAIGIAAELAACQLVSPL
jgi:hypothetical protein